MTCPFSIYPSVDGPDGNLEDNPLTALIATLPLNLICFTKVGKVSFDGPLCNLKHLC